MTLVVTSASAFGITVVCDKAQSRLLGEGRVEVLPQPVRKLYYSAAANISLAFWGRTRMPQGMQLEGWAQRFVQEQLGKPRKLPEVAEELAAQLAAELAPLREECGSWETLHRGVHVAGYDDGDPCIWHVHTGSRETCFHPPRAHADFPEIHGGGREVYRRTLADGKTVQLRNGFHELYSTVSASTLALRDQLQQEFQVVIPAPTLRGQLALSRATVRLAADLLTAADVAPQVSVEFDQVAFDANGRMLEEQRAPLIAHPLRPQPSLKGAPTSSLS